MAGDHSVTYFSTDSKADVSIMCIHQPYPLALASSPDSQCPVPGRLSVIREPDTPRFTGAWGRG